MGLKTVAITLDLDLIHEGHIEHIIEARKLGDKLILILDRDDQLRAKRGYVVKSQLSRLRIAYGLQLLGVIDEVVLSTDTDLTCAKTLRTIKPRIFAKGGDRTSDNIPESEKKVCEKIGCRIVYEVGRQLNSSTKLVEKLRKGVRE